MRVNKELLPRVHGSKVKKGYDFKTLDDKYAALDKAHLKITANMGTPTVVNGGSALHFDSVLFVAVLTAHPCSFAYDDFAIVPLPVDILTIHNGLPLWAASDFISDKTISGSEYWHKRYPSDRIAFAKKRNANTSAGRWREYRMPLNLNATHQFTAYSIGNKAEIERLLQYVKFIGKKNSYGYGRVLNWQVEETVDCLETIYQNKALPLPFAQKNNIEGSLVPSVSWTPPYWYRPNQCDCIDARR